MLLLNSTGDLKIATLQYSLLQTVQSLAMEFQQCVSLLASRPPHAHEHCEDEQHDDLRPQDLKASKTVSEGAATSNEPEDLAKLTARALVRSFQRLQETRVQIYADFRQGFELHQKTEHFPTFCSEITERFAEVSKRINDIEKLLRDEREQVAVAQLLRKVQLEEKEKLLLTSALLIEKMRLNDARKQAEPDDAAISFLGRSVETLTAKHTTCIEQINELLDDLRAESADLEE